MEEISLKVILQRLITIKERADLNRFQSIGKSKFSVSKVGLDIDGKIEFDKK